MMNLKSDLGLLEDAVRRVVNNLKGRRRSVRARHLYLVTNSHVEAEKNEKRRESGTRG